MPHMYLCLHDRITTAAYLMTCANWTLQSGQVLCPVMTRL